MSQLSTQALITIQVIGWAIGLLNVLVGCVLSVVLMKYIPALLQMWNDVSVLKTKMLEIEGDVSTAVKENIPELYGVLHDMDKKLAVVIDRMPKRHADPEHQPPPQRIRPRQNKPRPQGA